MNEIQPLVRIRDLRFRYPGADHDVLRIPALDIRGLGLTAVTGPSGAGKSTLVELMAGTLREPYDGTVEVLGQDWKGITKDAERQRLLRRIGLIPQDYAFIPGKSVRQALLQDLLDAQVPRALQEERVESALGEVGLAHFADREVNKLSGGQRQRVAVARMLARSVDLVIADEPTANLDPELVDGVMALLHRLGERVPVIVVTHDSHVAALCDRTVLMQPSTPYETISGETESSTRHGSRRLLWLVAVVAIITVAGTAGWALTRAKPNSTLGTHPGGSPLTAVDPLHIAMVSCPSPGQTTGAGQSVPGASGSSFTLSSAPPRGSNLAAYSDGVTTVLAPSGWSCISTIGANGVDTVTAIPKGDNAQAPTQLVSGGQDSASNGLIYSDTCNYFFKITGDPQYECPPPPNGEIAASRPSEWAITLEDVPGSGVVQLAPSNITPIVSVIVFTVSTASHEHCVLSRKEVCDFAAAAFAEAQKPVTKVHIFQAAPDAKGTSSERGSCFAGSIAVSRVSAFRCSTGSTIFDPCFVMADHLTLLCQPDPSKLGSGVLLHVPSLPSGGAANLPTTPWLFTLSDGRTCGAVTGAGIAGYPYGCGPAPYTSCQLPTVGLHEDLQTVCGTVDPNSQAGSETVNNGKRAAVVEAWY